MAFIDELARLNQQNFGSGLAKMGEAIKESEQNKTLVQLWNEFQLEKDRLSTSGEQLSEFNKKYDANTDENGFLTRGAPPKDKTNPDVEATLNLFGYLQKQEALLGTYEPFIQAFSVLGEDGIKIAKTLTDELASKIMLEEQKGQIPFKQLEYDNLKMNFDWNKDKYNSWLKDEKLRQDSFTASEYIMNSQVFDLIEGGDITTWRGDRLKKHNIAIKSVIDDAKKHFGENLSESAILTGLKLAMDMTGKSFKFVEKQPTGGLGDSGFSDMEFGFMKGNLQQWSARWNQLDDATKVNFREYMKNPVKFKENNPEFNTSEMGFEEMYEIYKPGGTYAQYWTILSGVNPSFNKMAVQSVDQAPRLMTSEGKENQPTIQMNMPFSDAEIIRMKDANSFIHNDFMWNPQWLSNYAQKKADEWQSKLNENMFMDYMYEAGAVKTYNTGIKQISRMSK